MQDGGPYARTPWSPPIVELTGDGVGHLLCWEQHERDGSWHAWVSTIRVQSTGDPVRHRHHVASMRADGIRRLESPEANESVPRRTLGRDGRIRPWTPPALRRGTGPAALAGCSCAHR